MPAMAMIQALLDAPFNQVMSEKVVLGVDLYRLWISSLAPGNVHHPFPVWVNAGDKVADSLHFVLVIRGNRSNYSNVEVVEALLQAVESTDAFQDPLVSATDAA